MRLTLKTKQKQNKHICSACWIRYNRFTRLWCVGLLGRCISIRNWVVVTQMKACLWRTVYAIITHTYHHTYIYNNFMIKSNIQRIAWLLHLNHADYGTKVLRSSQHLSRCAGIPPVTPVTGGCPAQRDINVVCLSSWHLAPLMHLKHPTTAHSYTHTHIWNNNALSIARIKD